MLMCHNVARVTAVLPVFVLFVTLKLCFYYSKGCQ